MKKTKPKKIYFMLSALTLFFTPLIYGTYTNEQYEFPKSIFLYIMVLTLAFVFLLKNINNALKFKVSSKITFVLFIYVLVNIVSAIGSNYTYTTVWGYYTRFNGGILSMVAYFVFYLVLVNIFDKKNLTNLLYAVIFTLIPISILGIYQKVTGTFVGERIYSTFGQPNWLATYIAMAMPLVLYQILVAKKWQQGMAVIYILSFISLWFTYSLSGLLAFIISTILLVVLNKDCLQSDKKLVGYILTGVVIFMVVIPGIYSQRIKDMWEDINKYASTQNYDNANEQLSDPGYIRLNLWESSVTHIVSSPKAFLIGSGPETFPYEFQKYRTPNLNYSSEWDFVINKPHNYYIEQFFEIGVLGGGIYLYLIYLTIKQKHKLVLPMLSALYISNIFGWPTVSTDLLFWVLLAKLNISQ